MGPDLLVAPGPFCEQPAPYEVTLPPGAWYDYWTGAKVGKGTAKSILKRKVAPELAILPVFVRSGAIIPSQPLVQNTGERPSGPLRLDVYPGPDCHGSIYQDAGDGFAYRAGDYYRATFRCRTTPDGLVVSRDPVNGAFRPWWKEIMVVVHDQPKGVSTAGGTYDARSRTMMVSVRESDLAAGITLRRQ